MHADLRWYIHGMGAIPDLLDDSSNKQHCAPGAPADARLGFPVCMSKLYRMPRISASQDSSRNYTWNLPSAGAAADNQNQHGQRAGHQLRFWKIVKMVDGRLGISAAFSLPQHPERRTSVSCALGMPGPSSDCCVTHVFWMVW